MMDKTTVWFFIGTVEVRSRGGETHCMTKFLASEGLTGVTKGAEGPAAVWCAWEAVELVTCGKSEHDGEGVGHEVFHDGIAECCVRVVINGFGGEEIVGVLKFGVAVVNVGGNEEAIAINFGSVVGVEGMEVVCEEFWDDPVWFGRFGGIRALTSWR